MLELQGVRRVVGGQVHIHDTNLTLENGTMNVLLGPTLSGKTSFLRMMAGLDKPDAGKVLWNGEDVTGVRVQDRNIAMVYQQFINYPSMSVYDNIASPLKVMGVSASEIDSRVKEAAEMLKLGEMLGKRPLELSGGQQQRCALARALVKNAELVLLDEPLANLDYKLREELRIEIPRIFEESGSIFVYATTEPEESLLLGGNTATLNEGRITQFGPTPEVYHHPNDVVTARVFSDPPMNFTPCIKQGSTMRFGDNTQVPADGQLEQLPDGDYTVGFRSNHLGLNAHSESMIEFKCKLVVTEITGSETYLHLQHGEERWVALVHGVHNMVPGEELGIWVDPSHAYIFASDGRLASPAKQLQAV